MKVTDFIGVKAVYDEHGQFIWGVNKDGEYEKLADLRGWGSIQQLFIKDKTIDLVGAAKFQDELGLWITEAINEKIEREKKDKKTILMVGNSVNMLPTRISNAPENNYLPKPIAEEKKTIQEIIAEQNSHKITNTYLDVVPYNDYRTGRQKRNERRKKKK